MIRVLRMPGMRYYTVNNENNPVILGFMNGPSAQAYKRFLDRQRSLHGYFPNQTSDIEPSRISIENEPLENLQKSCRDYNIGLLGIHHFDWDKVAVEFQAEDLTDDVGLEPCDPRRLLEVRFKER